MLAQPRGPILLGGQRAALFCAVMPSRHLHRPEPGARGLATFPIIRGGMPDEHAHHRRRLRAKGARHGQSTDLRQQAAYDGASPALKACPAPSGGEPHMLARSDPSAHFTCRKLLDSPERQRQPQAQGRVQQRRHDPARYHAADPTAVRTQETPDAERDLLSRPPALDRPKKLTVDEPVPLKPQPLPRRLTRLAAPRTVRRPNLVDLRRALPPSLDVHATMYDTLAASFSHTSEHGGRALPVLCPSATFCSGGHVAHAPLPGRRSHSSLMTAPDPNA
jgi:hypothetical protein